MAVAVGPGLAALAPELVEVLPVVAVNPAALGLVLGVGVVGAVGTLIWSQFRGEKKAEEKESSPSFRFRRGSRFSPSWSGGNNNNNFSGPCTCPCHMAEGLLPTLKPLIKRVIKEMLMKPLDPAAEKAADDVIAELEREISGCDCDGKLKENIKNITKENKDKIKEKVRTGLRDLAKKGYKEATVGREAGEIAEQVTNSVEQIIKDKLRACNCCGQRG